MGSSNQITFNELYDYARIQAVEQGFEPFIGVYILNGVIKAITTRLSINERVEWFEYLDDYAGGKEWRLLYTKIRLKANYLDKSTLKAYK